MEYIILYVMLCLLVAIMGNAKTVGYWGVFLWSLILSPVIGFFIGLFSKSTYRRNLENQAYQNMANQRNITSEIEKLHELKNKGLLSEEEFNQAKNKLLN